MSTPPGIIAKRQNTTKPETTKRQHITHTLHRGISITPRITRLRQQKLTPNITEIKLRRPESDEFGSRRKDK
jgi:hypothetical protein